MLKFKITSVTIAEKWCLKNISPRLYYFHNKIGGQGWHIDRDRDGVLELKIMDDKTGLMAMLALGEYIVR